MAPKKCQPKPSNNLISWIRIAEGIAIAVVTGLVTMYGTTAKLEVKFEMLEKQVNMVKIDVLHVQDLVFQHISKGK